MPAAPKWTAGLRAYTGRAGVSTAGRPCGRRGVGETGAGSGEESALSFRAALVPVALFAACAPTGPAPQVPAERDALVAGTPYNATTTIPCAGFRGQPAGSCAAGVVRRTDGSADVTVIWPDGGTRTLFFGPDGAVVSADVSQADGLAGYEVVGVKRATSPPSPSGRSGTRCRRCWWWGTDTRSGGCSAPVDALPAQISPRCVSTGSECRPTSRRRRTSGTTHALRASPGRRCRWPYRDVGRTGETETGQA